MKDSAVLEGQLTQRSLAASSPAPHTNPAQEAHCYPLVLRVAVGLSKRQRTLGIVQGRVGA